MADTSVSPIDLAHEPDFSIGPLLVRPSLRAVVHDGVEQQLEPRVMQVLVALVRRAGDVVSRDDLVEQCWGGRAVGEDAIQRPIARVRKLGEETSAFTVETIPRVGYRMSGQVSPATAPGGQDAAAAQAGRPPSKRFAIIAAALGVLALAAAAWGVSSFLGRGPALAPSIAVLPFENISGDPAKDYLARGVAMEVIDTLAQLPGIKVISRNSSFSFPANADPVEVGAKFDVAHVLSGKVQDQNGRITVTAELINAKTGESIRTDKYEAEKAGSRLTGVPGFFAGRIGGAMSIAFDVDTRRRIDGTGTKSLEAYDLYLRGLNEWWINGNQPASIDYYTKATAIDPDYAEAWAGLAIAHASTGFNYANPADARARQNMAFGLVERAVKLDPDLNMTQATFGAVATTQLKWIEGHDAFEKALAISRNEWTLVNYWFLLQRVGRLTEGAAKLRELEQVDPIRGVSQLGLHGLASLGRFEDIKKDLTRRGWFDSTEALALTNVLEYQINVHASRDDIRATLGKIAKHPEQARAELAARLLKVFDDPAMARTVLREAYTDPTLAHASRREILPYLAALFDDPDLVMRAWQDELPVNVLRTLYIWDPAFADARKLPGFKTLVRDLGMLDYWRAKGWADKCRPLAENDFECT